MTDSLSANPRTLSRSVLARSVEFTRAPSPRLAPATIGAPVSSTKMIEHVVLLDESGRAIGHTDKDTVHTTATPLHLAFSLYLFDDTGRVLMTRRAITKRTWPGVWTNSCCGHPGVGEELADAVRRRLPEELGVDVADLQCVLPDFAYEATDASGIRENEVCPVFAGRLVAGGLHPDVTVRANASEVMDWAWTPWDQLVTAIRSTPFAFSPWAVEQVHQLPESPCP